MATGARNATACLLTVQSFTSQRACSLQDITGLTNFLGLKLKRKLTMVGHMLAEKVVAGKIERKLLIPRSIDVNVLRASFITVHQELDFSSSVPREVK
jgi:hypothetical protein